MTQRRLFWLKILRWGSLFIFITGLMPSLAVFEVSQEPWRLFFDVLIWPLDGNPITFSSSERQLSAVLGGVLCGWAWLLYKLSHPEVFNEKIRGLMVQSAWVWFILDSAGTIYSGIPLNVLSNAGFLLILVVPLHKLRVPEETK